ncbi:MAG: phage portal protein [Vicinamibacteria bacterium]|nr:phage portal protein [Vicinamibacteria bacterium]
MLKRMVDVVRGAMLGARVAWGHRSQSGQSDLKNPAAWLLEALGARRTASGVDVTPATALAAVPFFAAVRNICEDLGSLPFVLYRRAGERARERARDHPLYSVLHDVPNPEMDSLQFVETMQAHATLRPCAYAEIVRSPADGSVQELWPLHPDRVRPFRLPDGSRAYRVTLPEGERSETGQTSVTLFEEQVFRLRSLSMDGWDGLSLVEVGRESLGLTIALELYGAEFFGNDATPGGFFEHPGEMGDEAQKRFLASLEKKHRGVGLGRKHKAMILEEGMKFAAGGLQNDQAQFLESRKYQVEEAARLARIPLHMIGAMDRATFSNIEHQGIDYVVHTIRPRAVRWERAVSLQLLTKAERREYYGRFLLDALMRGDLKSRYDAYAVGRQWGFLSANDICEMEERNPLPAGGDIYLEPENMRPAGKWAPKGGDQSRVARAFERLFSDAFERCVRKEASAFDRAAKRTMAEFEPWARAFFDSHAADVRAALEPVVDGLARLTHAEIEDVGDYADLLAKRYTRAALDDLAEYVRGGAEDPSAAIRRWAGDRRGQAMVIGQRECERALRLFSIGAARAA